MDWIPLGHDLSARIIKVTPEMAQRWLAKNDAHNRNVTWSRVHSYAGDIADDNWQLTHQGICFDAEDTLIDGQHRLHAIVEADKPILMLVFKDLRGGIGDTMDRGIVRPIAFIVGRSKQDTAALNVLRMLEQGHNVAIPMTPNECIDVADRHSAAIALSDTIAGKSRLLSPELASVLWAFPLAEDKVVDFANKLITGEMIRKGDPAYALRNYKSRNKRLTPWPLAMATLACLNAHLKGVSHVHVYAEEGGYRHLTAKRRAMGIPSTPDAATVPGPGVARAES